MNKKEISEGLGYFENELLGVYNKTQEAVNLARDGKWYHADTKMQGTKQKIMNLYEDVKSLRIELDNEDNSD